MPLLHFDERSGIVASETPWGRWWQTVSEVFVEINIPPGTPGKECKITIKPNYLECRIKDEEFFKGNLFKTIRPEESTWTVEERKKVLILLDKVEKYDRENLWTSLLEKEYEADPLVQHEMKKKLDLEKFQIENPGFDFSKAKLAKCYDKPPDLSKKNLEENENHDKPADVPEKSPGEKD